MTAHATKRHYKHLENNNCESKILSLFVLDEHTASKKARTRNCLSLSCTGVGAYCEVNVIASFVFNIYVTKEVHEGLRLLSSYFKNSLVPWCQLSN